MNEKNNEVAGLPVRCVEYANLMYDSLKEAMKILMIRKLPVGFVMLPPDVAVLCGSGIFWREPDPARATMNGLKFAGIPIVGCGQDNEGYVCCPEDFAIDFAGVVKSLNFNQVQVPFKLAPWGDPEVGAFSELTRTPVWVRLYEQLSTLSDATPWIMAGMIDRSGRTKPIMDAIRNM